MRRRSLRREVLPDGRIVARKCVVTPSRRDQLAQEAEALQAIQHPGVVQLVGTDGNDLLLEYIDGVELAALYRTPLAFGSVAHIAHSLLEAAAAVHAAGYIHCDISPRNIMVTPNGEVKLLDFGTACRKESVPDPEQLNGTPEYMSPEQAKGRVADERADLFAIGVILYELISGRFFRPRGIRRISLGTIYGHSAAPLRRLRRETPTEWSTFISRLTALDRDQRYADASAALVDAPSLRSHDQAQLITEFESATSLHVRRLWRYVPAAAFAAVTATTWIMIPMVDPAPSSTRSLPDAHRQGACDTSTSPPATQPMNEQETSSEALASSPTPQPPQPSETKSAVETRTQKRPKRHRKVVASQARPQERRQTEPSTVPKEQATTSQPRQPTQHRPLHLGSSLSTAHCYGKSNIIDLRGLDNARADCPGEP